VRTLTYITAAVSGFLFAVGLVLGGMTQPAKVIAFLDFFGNWDPSLAFVMGGAIAVYMPLYRLALLRQVPLGCEKYSFSSLERIDPRLIGGAALFGIGWGLAGYCPGPGIASVGTGATTALVFVGSMVGGMALYALANRAVVRPGTVAAR
jgi:uncharacterized protein